MRRIIMVYSWYDDKYVDGDDSDDDEECDVLI